MAISDIIAYGFGAWGSVDKVPTLGFDIGEAAAATVPDGVDYRAEDGRPHYRADDGRPHYRADDGRPHYRAD